MYVMLFIHVFGMILASTVVAESAGLQFDKQDLLPTRDYCGFQHSDDYNRPNKTETSIDELPWLALLLYEDRNGTIRGMCAGSLISHRYVLTAAHCVTHGEYNLISVHLGVYTIGSRTHCVESEQFNECNEPFQVYDIEKMVPHSQFVWRNLSNDIALLRLNRTVTYSDFIRPICLPLTGTIPAAPGDMVTIVGWGRKMVNNTRIETKKKVNRRVITNAECLAVYPNFPLYNRFCSNGIDTHNKLLCQGDSGGPVMFSVRHQWYQEGIYNSFTNFTNCSLKTGIHLKVAYYIDWILETIEV